MDLKMLFSFYYCSLLVFICFIVKGLDGASPTDSRSFVFTPKVNLQPQLILIAGCTGTGIGLVVSGILSTLYTD